MKRSLFFILLLINIIPIYARRDKNSEAGQVYVGGSLGIGIPTSIGRNSDEISFSDVCRLGFASSINCTWMQSEAVGVGAELVYMSNPYKEEYWINLTTNYRGSFDAEYKTMGLDAFGKLFFGKNEIRPYFGVFVGGFYVKNSLSFTSDPQFIGTTQDASVSYEYNKIKIGFGGDLGFYYRISSTTRLSLNVRLSLLVNKQIKDSSESYYTAEYTNDVVMNPHGNQNAIVVSAGLNFGIRNKRK